MHTSITRKRVMRLAKKHFDGDVVCYGICTHCGRGDICDADAEADWCDHCGSFTVSSLFNLIHSSLPKG
jgi:hypothetical protein